MNACSVQCLEPDAFGFAGAANVYTIYLQYNPLTSFPEGLLWNTPNLLLLYARANEVSTIPENFFQGVPNLMLLFTTTSGFTHLPHNVMRGLVHLKYLVRMRLMGLLFSIAKKMLHATTLFEPMRSLI